MPRRGPTPEPTALAFGEAVHRCRLARDETLEDVAGRIRSMDPAYLGEIERGWHAPTVTTAKRIADALKLPLSELVRDI